MTFASRSAPLPEPGPKVGAFLEDVLEGLRRHPRRLRAKYFYDEAGSRLFERICELPEYYLTRTELGILRRHAVEIAERLGADCFLVELGSGSSRKVRVLLDELVSPRGYAPVDISPEHLREESTAIAREYPHLAVSPVCLDYSAEGEIQLPLPRAGVTVFYPGSSIGNFHRPEAERLLETCARICGPGGRLLIGIDLKKDPRMIERAYNDSLGVTAEFNRNLLRRINRELRGDFIPEDWYHHAFYEPVAGRIEMHLVSARPQVVTIAEEPFTFGEGESIRTECSYKYTVEEFVAMARDFSVESGWTDPDDLFALLLLRARPRSAPESDV
jgi:dimethylhistidine N-methyltransferase